MRTIDLPPNASAFFEGSRDIGYTMPTALADVVDNSLAAEASTVDIYAEAQPFSVATIDDGYGMTQDELIEAMRYASKDPRDKRDIKDLGRFGLGLKLASLSQCQKLTVVSRKDGETASAVWDQAEVDRTNEWRLGIFDDPEQIPFVERLGESGTLVLWEQLDSLEELESLEEKQREFNRTLTECRDHLELTFHRYLSGQEAGITKCVMAINDNPLDAHDPFRKDHPATQTRDQEHIGTDVTYQVFTLPQQAKSTSDDWKKYGRAEGYLKTQGFYLYRQKRLIIHGTWLGIARQREVTKLTRVQVDISNNLDRPWGISLDKSRARLPAHVRTTLRRLVANISYPSRRVVSGRGRRLWDRLRDQFWTRNQSKNEIAYEINRDNPVVHKFEEGLSRDRQTEFQQLLRLIERSTPVDAIYADAAAETYTIDESMTEDELRGPQLFTTFDHYLKVTEGDVDKALEMTGNIEPFSSNWQVSMALLIETNRIPESE